MRNHWFCTSAAALAVILVANWFAAAQTTSASKAAKKSEGKEVLIPPRVNKVPDGNDYDDPESEFCHKRSKQTDNFVLFWAKEYGDDPLANPDQRRRFDVDAILKECDRFYDYYVNTMKWVDKDKSVATKNKFLIYVFGGNSGTASGGTAGPNVGAFWTPASRIARGPYGVVAHELGHSFQALLRTDGFTTPSGGSIHEMTSQWMLWQVYPEWMTFENYHLTAFMRATHLAFLHPDNQYHSCYPLEYWSNKHGVEIIGRVWREGKRGEDTAMIYKRITNLNQEQFNDEMFDACRRFVTWDMPRIEKVAARYANQHTTSLNKPDDGWYQIAADQCPQNYGYNAIKLKVPAPNTKVRLDFKGIVGAEGFRNIRPENAGWRYGFLASKEDGSRVYSDTFSKSDGTAQFTVPANTKFLWLVVMGAPTEHWTHGSGGPGDRGPGGRGGAAPQGGNGGARGVEGASPEEQGAAGEGAEAQQGAAGERGAAGRGTQGAGREGQPGARGARGNRGTRGARGPTDTNVAQWPYRIKLTGTEPDDSIVH